MIYGIIYKATNKINGKIYIGQTITGLNKRVDKHFSDSKYLDGLFCRALKKYGRDGFIWDTIDKAINNNILDLKEIYWIDFYKSTNKKIGYNILPGGNSRGSFKVSKETRKKLSRVLKGRVFTEEWKKNMSISRKGMVKSYEWRKIMSEKNSGKKNPFYGKKHTRTTKEKMRLKKIGYIPWNLGLKLNSIKKGMRHKKSSNLKNRLSHLNKPNRISDDIRNKIISMYNVGIYSHRDLALFFK